MQSDRATKYIATYFRKYQFIFNAPETRNPLAMTWADKYSTSNMGYMLQSNLFYRHLQITSNSDTFSEH